MILEMTMN
jgi:hypothetical protein